MNATNSRYVQLQFQTFARDIWINAIHVKSDFGVEWPVIQVRAKNSVFLNTL